MKNLIIGCVGDESLHHHWMTNGNPEFDMILIYYGDEKDKWKNDATFYWQAKGSKWEIISKVKEYFTDVISSYDAIWLPDDDISINAKEINRLFRLFHEENLWLAQPALTSRSYISWKLLKKRPLTYLRYTNFVEVMMPMMSQSTYQQLAHTFSESISGWGLDFYWPKLLKYPKNKIAVFDHICATHTRPVNTNKGFYTKLKKPAKMEMKELLDKYQIVASPKSISSVYKLASLRITF